MVDIFIYIFRHKPYLNILIFYFYFCFILFLTMFLTYPAMVPESKSVDWKGLTSGAGSAGTSSGFCDICQKHVSNRTNHKFVHSQVSVCDMECLMHAPTVGQF